MIPLQTKVVTCGPAFDTYKGQILQAELNQYNVPPANFCGPLPSGNLWTAKYFCDGFSHEGGWIWNEGNINAFARDVNNTLFKLRESENLDKLRISENQLYSSYKKVKAPAIDHYYYLCGQKFYSGDIIKVAYSTGYSNEFAYGLVVWVRNYGNPHRWHLSVIGNDFEYEYDHNTYKAEFYHIETYRFTITNATPKEGYRFLCPWGREMWRYMNNVKGQPKFK